MRAWNHLERDPYSILNPASLQWTTPRKNHGDPRTDLKDIWAEVASWAFKVSRLYGSHAMKLHWVRERPVHVGEGTLTLSSGTGDAFPCRQSVFCALSGAGVIIHGGFGILWGQLGPGLCLQRKWCSPWVWVQADHLGGVDLPGNSI